MAWYEEISAKVEACRVTLANWDEAVDFANRGSLPAEAVMVDNRPALFVPGNNDNARIGYWLIIKDGVITVRTDEYFQKNYKRRIPRDMKTKVEAPEPPVMKDDAAPAAKKKVKAA